MKKVELSATSFLCLRQGEQLCHGRVMLVSWYLGVYKHRDLCMVTPSGRPNSAHSQNDMHACVFVHFCKEGFFPQ